MYYFAYGSNMLRERLQRRVPSARTFTTARLPGYTLKFHKGRTDGSGKGNVIKTDSEDDIVYGVVYEIDEREKPLLDDAEGLGYGYFEKNVLLKTPDAQIKAYMYVANKDYINDTLIPYQWYKDFIVYGARQHNLPAEYIKTLEAVPAKEDPDKARAEMNRGIIPKILLEIESGLKDCQD